ncbi:MAG: nucleotidyl transferase AbiEii/AbiGii toxin family protein [Thermosphaera sp.]
MENILAAAAKVARFLEEQKIPYAVIGGLALQHWGEPRYTRDVDITVLVPSEHLSEFLDQALERFSPRIPNAKTFALRHRVLLLKVEDVPVDISLGIPGYEEEALARAVAVEFPGVGMLRLLAPEDLVVHKCVAGRPRDLEDVEGILIRQRLELDLRYIRRWLREFREVVEDHDPLEIFEGALRRARRRLREAEGDL